MQLAMRHQTDHPKNAALVTLVREGNDGSITTSVAGLSYLQDLTMSQTQYESEIPSEVLLQHLHSSRIKKCKAGSRPPERMVDWRCLSPIIPTGQLRMATMRTNQRYWKFWRTADGETDVCFNFWSWSNFDTGKEISNIPPWLSQTTSAEWCVSVPRQWNLMTNKSPAIKEFSTANPSSCLLRHCPNFQEMPF